MKSKLQERSSVAAVLDNFDRYESDDFARHDLTVTGITDDSTSAASNVYPFTPKFLKSCKNNPLCGICVGQWCKLLWTRRHHIDYRTYWPRLVMISALSLFNSCLAIIETILYAKQIEQVTLSSRPVFVLGHPRTGTTLLHSLLALDTEQFAICTTFCAGFPSAFLWLEDVGKPWLSGVMDETRPMDNMPLHFDLPQEDELATNIFTAGDAVSPYMAIWFMNLESTFRPFFAFDSKSATGPLSGDVTLPEDQMTRARNLWTTSFLHLLKKLTLRARIRQPNSRNRLLLKSPVHTARIPMLLQLFPDAQFIYIHRHPYDVFRSAAHMADTTYWYTYFNTPTPVMIQEFILRQYEILWEKYQEGKKLLIQSDNQQLVEVSYEELAQDPILTVEGIYRQLGWELSSSYKQRLDQDLAFRVSYEKNSHRPLPPGIRKIINDRWGPSFDALGYSKDDS